MALQLYSRSFWTPDGLAFANRPVQVFPYDQNVFAPLFADAAGTIPLPNPGHTTNGAGLLTFYAEVGQYWIHLDTETFLDDVGLSQEQSDWSTGVASGADLTPNAFVPTSMDLGPLVGYIVDVTGPVASPPVVTRVDYPGGTVPLDGAALVRTTTWWLMDAAQNVIQQATFPTQDQFRRFLVLGVSIFDTAAMALVEAQTLPTILAQPANQLTSIMNGLGPFVIDGNELSPNGANLQLNKSAGQLFARAFNYINTGVYTDNPHVTMSAALTPATLRRILRTSSFPTPPAVTTIDPANYDLNGVLTPVPGGPSVSTVQRVYLFAADTPSLRIAVQYGQTVYATPQLAVASIGAGNKFVPAPITRIGALIGYLAVTRSCTDLSDPAQATFVYSGKFATP